jgi:hypothetical protein
MTARSRFAFIAVCLFCCLAFQVVPMSLVVPGLGIYAACVLAACLPDAWRAIRRR